MSSKVFSIIKREYVTRVRTKGFIIGTLAFPVMLVIIFAGIFLFAEFFQPDTKTYYIVDQTGVIYNEFVGMLDDTLDSGQPKYRFTKQEIGDKDVETVVEEYRSLVTNKEIDGYIIIPEDILILRSARYAARNVGNIEEQDDIEDALSRIVTNMRLANMGVSPEEIRKEMARGRVKLLTRQVTDAGEIQKSGISSFMLTYFLSYVILLMTLIYGVMVMRSIIEEKSQRITETVISSVKPLELMVGKIVGVCSLGLTQLFVMGLIILTAVNYSGVILGQFGVNSVDILDFFSNIQFSATIFGFLLLFFLTGFVFYASMFAAIGAMVNTEDEGQQFQLPLTFLVMIGFFIMFSVAQNPETNMAFWASLVPFFTPIVMFARIAVSDPALPSGAILSIFTMTGSTLLLILFVAKIYRVGILMYGKKPSIKELIKWVRYS